MTSTPTTAHDDALQAQRSQTAPPTAKSTDYIPSLDGLRAISVSLVMVAHSGFEKTVPGGLGVTIFFFLSGYLITTLLIKETIVFNSISLKNFYIRRFLRLSPELFLLILYGVSVGLLYKPVYIADIASALTYTSNYAVLYREHMGDATVRWPHLWSLAVEEHFYLTFPLLMMFTGKNFRRLFGVLLGACAATLIWRIAIVTGVAPFGFSQTGLHPYTYVASDTRVDSIAYGCLTAVGFYLFPGRLGSAGKGCLVLAASALIMLMTLVVRSPDFRESLRYSLQGVSLLLFFIVLFRSPAGPPVIAALENQLLRRLGVLSYGAYLWHLEGISLYKYFMGIQAGPNSVVTRLGIVVACFALSIIAAQASLTLTSPLSRLRSRYHKKVPFPEAT